MAATTTRQPSLFAQVSAVPPQPASSTAEAPTSNPHHPKQWHIPRLLLKVRDVSHEGAIKYFNTTNTQKVLHDAVIGVLETLYTHETAPTTQRSITLILQSMDGVANTTGSDLDNDHKKIYFSLDYIGQIPDDRVQSEILGVIRHEMVHCWQYDACGTAPGGLIEGISDFVRMKAGFSPPHWKRRGDNWDAGYATTAYFLDYLCSRFGNDTVKRINLALKHSTYTPELWVTISGGIPIEKLWDDYKTAFNLHPTPAPEPSDPEKEKEGYAVVAQEEAIPPPPSKTEPKPPQSIEKPLPIPPTPIVTYGSSMRRSGSPGSGDVWPFAANTPVAHIMLDRLKNMRFEGKSGATRYILEFEALIDRLQPEMSDVDKKLLLCTSFHGPTMVNWYETSCRAVTYHQLKEAMQEAFKNY
ncbi:BSP-domain-containing protein [Choiromyces venosus 120613-1]|uniref:BSP-domain-containing protein n=1 Tax=Choiromyces venosus 120613-1 TaxID=1336337 RepID=A0A3N4JPC0_9PEZI|nr:BSP-domain-containing protein [Choiromyces venosus 120613-1]